MQRQSTEHASSGTNECWIHTGRVHPTGYGAFKVNGKWEMAHRNAWEIASGTTIPKGMSVCHTCDVPLCVRNDEKGVWVVDGVEYPRWGHLFLAPQSVNIRDMWAKGRGRVGHVMGEAHYKAKLSADDVVEIKRRYAIEDQRPADLHRAYGVTDSAIHSILAGRAWKSVTTPYDLQVKTKIARHPAGWTGPKLTPAIIADIFFRVSMGERKVIIARSLGVAHSTIKRLFRKSC